MSIKKTDIKGLTAEEVVSAREIFGENRLNYKIKNSFFEALKSLVKEPMLILLFITSSIYFISGNIGDGIYLVSAIILVSTISLYQYSRSKNALSALEKFTQPICKVIRNGEIHEISGEEIVIGDFIIVEEGTSISADGIIIQSNDFSVNESILTGESFSINKNPNDENNLIFRGTTVDRGLAIAKIVAIGNETKLGKIGKSIENITEEKTPLELQINNFVKKMVVLGIIVFIIVWVLNYLNSFRLINSLIKALTIAMSILPEEIPIAFTTFMALGAWRLMKMGIVVKKMKTVETLGSATVICIDKTGTITENRMTLAKLYNFSTNIVHDLKEKTNSIDQEIITIAMWASEPLPFDPMEISLHDEYSKLTTIDERSQFHIIHEYPLDGKPPMMTHIFENEKKIRIIAAKGAPEAIINVSELTNHDKLVIEKIISQFANDGYRVLGVAKAKFEDDNYPLTQQEFKFKFIGLLAFYDPPKKNIQAVLNNFYKAGISVKIITGDNAATTISIAKQIGFTGFENSISGDELMQLNEKELKEFVIKTNIFTRMYPDAKLRIINALKSNNEIVAMTGDGVNDGPALKAAHIGIAMGKKGTEIAKQSASLILLEDDLSKMIEAIAMGRKIYSNLKKAIRYIISIHIPIILTVFIPLALGWIYPNIFSPIHIIFLELIMGPTCSIIYENESLEIDSMIKKPRQFTSTFFNRKELVVSIIQGLFITFGTLSIYEFAVSQSYNENTTRTMVFLVLITANIFLTLVNRSFSSSIFETMKNKNNLVLLINSITISITALLLFVKPINHFFEFEKLSIIQLILSVVVGFLSIIWFEIVKLLRRKSKKQLIIC